MAGPIAAYNFDELSGNVLDVTGNGNHFALSGDASRTAGGHTNGGLTFAGAGPAGPTIASPALGQSTDRTVMAWLKLDSSPGTRWPAIWDVTSIGSGAWGILLLSGNLHIQARNSSTFVRASTTAPTDTAWHHVAGTYVQSTGVVTLYLDGVSGGTNTITGPLRTDADNLILGSADGEPFAIDDVRIFTSALTGPEIVTAMNTPVSAGITQALGVATETDAAQALTRVKRRTPGVATSTETAQPIGRRKSRALGIATSLTTAVSLAKAKVRTLGAATEADTARPLPGPSVGGSPTGYASTGTATAVFAGQGTGIQSPSAASGTATAPTATGG